MGYFFINHLGVAGDISRFTFWVSDKWSLFLGSYLDSDSRLFIDVNEGIETADTIFYWYNI